jgi:hypothetical protein
MDERQRGDEADTDGISGSAVASGAAGGTAVAAGAQGASGDAGDDSLLGPAYAEGGDPSSGDSTFTSP